LKAAGGVFQNGIDLISTNAGEPLKELIDRCAAL
jgi:hypothetical protein